MSCPSSIRPRDSNPRPLDREPPPITTRPGLPPRRYNLEYFFKKKATSFGGFSSKWQNTVKRRLTNFYTSYTRLVSSRIEPCCWSSGRHSHLILRCSEFESGWGHGDFFCKCCLKSMKLYKKRPGLTHI